MSYHDLEKSTYDAVRAQPLTRIHGRPSYRKKEILKKECKKTAEELKVDYRWSGSYGLLPLIIGAERMALEHPDLDPFVMSERPPNTPPDLANNAGNQAVRLAVADNEAKKRDYAIIQGFIKGTRDNIKDALDLEYYEDLEHVEHGYDNVTPLDFITHLETEHCPCDKQAVKECRDHYFRGWQRNNGAKTENLIKFAKRLDEEQAALQRNGIIIANEEKKQHYLLQCYKSGVFPHSVLREWKRRPEGDQTYTQAKAFFQAEEKSMRDIERIMGNTAGAMGYDVAASAIGKGLEGILEKFNTTVEQRITATVKQAMEQYSPTKGAKYDANAVGEVTSTLAELKHEMVNLKN